MTRVEQWITPPRVVILAMAGALLGTLAAACAPVASPNVEGELQAALDRHVTERPDVPGAVLHVEAPAVGVDWDGASGLFSFEDDRPLTPNDPFRSASVTKTFTSALVLRLVEQGRVRLDDRAAEYLEPEIIDRVQETPALGRSITVRQLLNHTSGVYDYATDDRWRREVLDQPKKTWHPRELIDVAIEYGDPYFALGEGYAYSDTGYVMVGLIVEEITGKPLAHVMRRTLGFKRLGLETTWTEWHEQPPDGAGQRVHQYYGARDTTHFNPTFDTFGGGGLVTTGDDLNDFARALFDDRVFKRAGTLETMLEPSVSNERPGLGIFRYDIAGETVWGHTGFFGAFMWYVPRLDLSMAGSNNQASESSTPLIEEVITIVRAEQRGDASPKEPG